MDAAEAAPPFPERRDRTAALAAALVTVGFWASAFVGIRSAGSALSPGALALGRLVVGTVALAALLRARGERLPSRRELRPVLPALLLCGLLWFGAYNVTLNAAERRVDAGTAAMLVNVGPIVIAILAGLLLREGFPPRLLAGCAAAFAGVILIGLATALRRLARFARVRRAAGLSFARARCAARACLRAALSARGLRFGTGRRVAAALGCAEQAPLRTGARTQAGGASASWASRSAGAEARRLLRRAAERGRSGRERGPGRERPRPASREWR